MNAQDMLDEMSRVWMAGRQQYRDTRIRVGGMIHEYLVERLKKADELTQTQREGKGYSRAKIMAEVAKHLKVTKLFANEMVRAAMVVRLLSEGGDVGTLTFSTLSAFSVLIMHTRGRVRRGVSGGDYGGNSILPSERERWVIKCPVGENRELFATAVREGWTYQETPGRLRGKRHQSTTFTPTEVPTIRGYNNVARNTSPERFDEKAAVRKASVGDAVEMLYGMLSDVDNALEIVDRLREKLTSPRRLLLT